jgi:N-acetylglutamate synthase-like GNAT family acetyltransferase
MIIRRALFTDLNTIVSLIDNEFTKEGYGFVNKAQIETEIRNNRVIVADDDGICGVRIGVGTIWNLVVSHDKRGEGIGKGLIEYLRPHTIRVKSDPIGHLSKDQKDNFVDPTGFYEARLATIVLIGNGRKQYLVARKHSSWLITNHFQKAVG